jgi:uncharacterized damage-inducible protein DinB
MSSPLVAQLVFLLDEAFEGEQWHSFVNNLNAVDPRDWEWIPAGGDRSIREIVEHIGVCKLMYDNHAFGDAALTWDHALVQGESALSDIASAIEWLRNCHAQIRGSVAALTDDELSHPRRSHAGTYKETRWLIATVIEHDLYHSGEINLIRSLTGRETNWPKYW